MIEWDGASESEAFQKLAADVAAVIGAPSAQTQAPETVAPEAPEHGAVATQAVVTRRAGSAVSRTSARRRTVQLSLAGALVLALLATVYRTRPGGGDISQPPPTRAPAEASGLRLTAVLAAGSEPLTRGVSYEVYTAERDAAGERRLVIGSSQYADPPRFPLPVGRYFVTATHGSASASTVVDVTAGEITHQILNLGAGVLRLTAVLSDGGEALARGVAYSVHTAARDAEGNRRLVVESNQYADPPRFPLPAGHYFVTATYGSASANAEVEVTPAGVTQQILNLRAGILRLTAVLADGSEALARGVAYQVHTAAQDAEGNRKLVTESNQVQRPSSISASGRTLLRNGRVRERVRKRGRRGRADRGYTGRS